MLGITLSFALLTGCSENNSTTASDAGQTIYGQVAEISDDILTIEVGTQKEMEKPEDTPSDSDDSEKPEEMPDGNAPQDGETPSMLDLTGEEKEIQIESDTVIKRQSMGGQPGGGMGEAPSGEAPSGEAPSEEPPSDTAPSGESKEESSDNQDTADTTSGSSEAPDRPSGEAPEQSEEEISLDDISEGDTVTVTYDDDGNVEEITVISMGQGPGQSGGIENYDAAEEYSEDTEKDGETITSTGTDENAIHLLDGASAVLKNLTVTRESSDSTGGDNSSFYGVGAALLTTDGTAYVGSSTISTDAAGAAGIFAYDAGKVYTSDTKITTTQDTSGGIHVAGGGTLLAWNMDVETSGESSAAIRSDRGGGKLVADGGTYTSNGIGSPAVYSTADIAVNNAQLTSNGSEAVCIEGLNSLRLFDCDLTGNMSDNEQNDCTWNVILYQSMSGDSEVGNSTFEMDGGSLTAQNGGMFYTTNTESTFTLSNVNITYANDSEFFLRCTGNHNQRGWGTSGQNGADCLFTAISQEMTGDVLWDSISQLDFYMTSGSTLTGAVINDETYAQSGGEGYCNLTIDQDSTWIVTKDSTLTSLSNAGTIKDADGKTVTIKGTDQTVYAEGDSALTVTVDSYDKTGDVSGASEISSWSDYDTEKPSQL